jgi:hypothetical protein
VCFCSGESEPKMSLLLREVAESRLFNENPVGCNKADDEVERGAPTRSAWPLPDAVEGREVERDGKASRSISPSSSDDTTTSSSLPPDPPPLLLLLDFLDLPLLLPSLDLDLDLDVLLSALSVLDDFVDRLRAADGSSSIILSSSSRSEVVFVIFGFPPSGRSPPVREIPLFPESDLLPSAGAPLRVDRPLIIRQRIDQENIFESSLF